MRNDNCGINVGQTININGNLVTISAVTCGSNQCTVTAGGTQYACGSSRLPFCDCGTGKIC